MISPDPSFFSPAPHVPRHVLPALQRYLHTQPGSGGGRFLGPLRYTRRTGRVFAYGASTNLARFCHEWMDILGLQDVYCYLHAAALPRDIGAEMCLGVFSQRGAATGEYREVDLRDFDEFSDRALSHDYDLLVISVARRYLRLGAWTPCTQCPCSQPLIHHIILHELVHAVAPYRAGDNVWTDQQVFELFRTSGLVSNRAVEQVVSHENALSEATRWPQTPLSRHPR